MTAFKNVSAVYLAYSYDLVDLPLKAKDYYVINNYKMYLISTKSLESDSGKNESILNDCVNSFKFSN